jgi:hypothetical protein
MLIDPDKADSSFLHGRSYPTLAANQQQIVHGTTTKDGVSSISQQAV